MVKSHTRKHLPKSIKELKDPNLLKSGHIKKLSGNRFVVVKRDKEGIAKYKPAGKYDIKCEKALKSNIEKMLSEVKSKKKTKRIKTYPQALAVAYSKTSKKFPKCELIKRDVNENNIQDGGLLESFYSINKLQYKILNLLIKKGYIKDINGNKINVKKNKINNLINSYTQGISQSLSLSYLKYYILFLDNIDKKIKIYKFNEYLNYINKLLKIDNNILNELENINNNFFSMNKTYSYSTNTYIIFNKEKENIKEKKKYIQFYKYINKFPYIN